jgi:hypothetical protein
MVGRTHRPGLHPATGVHPRLFKRNIVGREFLEAAVREQGGCGRAEAAHERLGRAPVAACAGLGDQVAQGGRHQRVADRSARPESVDRIIHARRAIIVEVDRQQLDPAPDRGQIGQEVGDADIFGGHDLRNFSHLSPERTREIEFEGFRVRVDRDVHFRHGFGNVLVKLDSDVEARRAPHRHAKHRAVGTERKRFPRQRHRIAGVDAGRADENRDSAGRRVDQRTHEIQLFVMGHGRGFAQRSHAQDAVDPGIDQPVDHASSFIEIDGLGRTPVRRVILGRGRNDCPSALDIDGAQQRLGHDSYSPNGNCPPRAGRSLLCNAFPYVTSSPNIGLLPLMAGFAEDRIGLVRWGGRRGECGRDFAESIP